MPKTKQMKELGIYQGNNEVQKNNTLIKCRTPLTLFQRKGFLFVLQETINQIKACKGFKDYYQVDVSTYQKIMGFNSNNIGYIRDNLDDLLTKKLTWNTDKGGEVHTACMASFKLENGIIEWALSPHLRDKILKTGFTLLKLSMLTQFKSTYSLALYELLSQWKQRHWVEFSLKDFRQFMGVKDDEYVRMFHFKNKVLQVAIEELNRTSDIIVFCTDKKQGRNIVGFRFHFYTMDKKQIKQRDQFYQDKKKYLDELKKDKYINKLIANKIEFKINDEWLAMTEKGLCRSKKVIISLEFFYGFIKAMKSIGSEIETRKSK